MVKNSLMASKNNTKTVKSDKDLVLLKGDSLEKQNQFIQGILIENKVSNPAIRFEPEELQNYINRNKTFGKGLIKYLNKLNDQLKKIDIDNNLKLYIFQILSELGSLVFPNTSACYSLVPNDLRKINWEPLVNIHMERFRKNNPAEYSKIETLLITFANNKFEKTVSCLVSLCLCTVLIQSLKKNQNALLVNDKGQFAKNELDFRPRIKASNWIDKLSYDIQTHLIGLCKIKIDKKQTNPLNLYSQNLAIAVTKKLLEKQLITSYKTVQDISNNNDFKNSNYFVWSGSSLLVFPKSLALPMVYPPNDWAINENKGADNGGHLLSTFTNICYQGYLDSKSHKTHNHSLFLRRINHLNNLQKVKFTVNDRMVLFYNKYKEILTAKEIVLLDDRWLKTTQEMYEAVLLKYTSGEKDTTKLNIGEMVNTELISKRNETMRCQEALMISEFYFNKAIYWPAVQDFRGRVYRIGHLNIQSDTFIRSLTAFQSDKSLVNRKKSKYTMAKFNLLLREVLVEETEIKKWDAVFGNRLINNEAFEQLLLKDLLVEKLSLIQVGQLLLIRQGAYDKVGVYYDASASAYQIMGVINADLGLCKQTNVLQVNNKKQDIYDFFLKELQKNMHMFNVTHKLPGVADRLNEHLKNNFNRKLVKAIVMPLIYGKTSSGFAEDLEEFFKADNLATSKTALIALASDIIKILKQNDLFQKVNLFMKALRAVGGFLFECDNFTIKGYYNDASISYNKEAIEELRLYYKAQNKRYISQKIKLSRPIIDNEGNFIKSKTKSVNAFVANYVHFLDATVCHYIVEKVLEKNNENFKIGTVHDSFLIHPSNAQVVRERYKQGLLLAHKLHVYNMFYWLRKISLLYKNKNKAIDSFISKLDVFMNENKQFETHLEYRLKCVSKYETAQALQLMKKEATPSNKARLATIIEYIEQVDFTNLEYMENALNSNCGELLFSDNK